MAKAKEWPASAIEMVETAKLKPYAQNAKAHSPEQIEQLGKSYDTYGWTNPILVDEKGEIIAGHGRVMMAIAKGIPSVPVMTARGWTAAQKRAYRLFDNKSAELSSWDPTILKGELVALDSGGLKVLPITGFTKLEVAQLLKPEAPTKSSSKLGNPIIQYNIVFDNEAQQKAWFEFLRRIKAGYPQHETLGARLLEFLTEQLGNG